MLVPGDIIRLSTGDRVPTDARLVESRDLYVQQAVLTGESKPAEKEARQRVETKQPTRTRRMGDPWHLGDRRTAAAQRVVTGPRTEHTQFEVSLRQFGRSSQSQASSHAQQCGELSKMTQLAGIPLMVSCELP